MATVMDDYPLFAEAINEKSLTGAGLNFPINAYYHKKVDQTKHNVTSYEIILGDISQFAILTEAGVALEKIYSYWILLLRKGYLRRLFIGGRQGAHS